jgi:hypothetical protein
MTYLIEYLGEYGFIFETVLVYVSGDQLGYFEGKKAESKISRLGTFKCVLLLPQSRCLFNKSVNFRGSTLRSPSTSRATPRAGPSPTVSTRSWSSSPSYL